MVVTAADVSLFLTENGLDTLAAEFSKEWAAKQLALQAATAAAADSGAAASPTASPKFVTQTSPQATQSPGGSAAEEPAEPAAEEEVDNGDEGCDVVNGVFDIDGEVDHLWNLDPADNVAPVFAEGAGMRRPVYNQLAQRGDAVAMSESAPYNKTAAPANLPLESFDLRVIFHAGRTGFEENKEFPIVVGSVIAGRYQITEYLGSAAFSRVVQCTDMKHNADVCVKIIRNSKDFLDQSLDEIKLLLYISSSGDADSSNVLQLYDYFYYKEHIFLVCELLRDNLYEFSKFNREHEKEFYFTMVRIQSIAKQILKALAFVHNLNLLHCDLKPENILIKSYSRCVIKVIDFGSSCYSTDSLSSYVQSRCYRAPEVVLGAPYDGRIDVWSLGAILPELITGRVLFHNECLPAMLAKIASICGPFPAALLRSGRHTCRFVTKHGAFFENVDVEGEDARLKFHFARQTSIAAVCGSADPEYQDFIAKCLMLDAAKRPTAAELLEHPFITKEIASEEAAPAS
jgi:hypothetical protein